MTTNRVTDNFEPTEDDVYGDVGSALGKTLKKMVPRLCRKYLMDEDSVVRAVASAAVDAGVFLEAVQIGLTGDEAILISERVYKVMCDQIDERAGRMEEE